MLFAGFGLIALSGTFFLAFWKVTNNNPDARFFVGLVCLGIEECLPYHGS